MPSWEAELVQIQENDAGNQLDPEHRYQEEPCERVLSNLGFRSCRVHPQDTGARIEVESAEEFEKLFTREFRDEIIRSFRKLGFTYIAVDLQERNQRGTEEKP
jgi:PP-loop superfamily ATP-utilizing enzyme